MSEAREAHATAAPVTGHGDGGAAADAGHAGDVHHEPLPVSVYLGVAAALFVLTGITVGISSFHFGEWNVVVAMLVASIKASLVVLYFMNLKHEPDRINRVVFVAALLFLVIYATLTLADQLTRGRVDAVRGQRAPVTARFTTPETPPGGAPPGQQATPPPPAPAPAGK